MILLNNYKSRIINNVLSQFNIPIKISNDYINHLKSGSIEKIWGFCFRDVRNVDFSDVDRNIIKNLAFNSDTIWGNINGFNPDNVLEISKNSGLNIGSLNSQGIDGSGVNVAVIDKPILYTHNEYRNRIKYFEIDSNNKDNERLEFHGMTCVSILAGETTGIAKSSNIYYFAYPDQMDKENLYWDYYFKSFEMIKEHNKISKDKISIVSVSAGIPKDKVNLKERLNHFIKEFEKEGCYIVTASQFAETFNCAGANNVYSHDDINRYIFDDTWQQRTEWNISKIHVPSGGRTSACNSGKDKFMYLDSGSCYSWAIPFVCGVFALCKQIKPNMTLNDFCQISKITANKNKYGLLVINPIEIINLIK
ncbi:MAG: peptidase [Haloplasmataceae bacterium]|jgi:subtilisin family serine protease|nr:peptidase [Haloplasmataceae bacterium]